MLILTIIGYILPYGFHLWLNHINSKYYFEVIYKGNKKIGYRWTNREDYYLSLVSSPALGVNLGDN